MNTTTSYETRIIYNRIKVNDGPDFYLKHVKDPKPIKKMTFGKLLMKDNTERIIEINNFTICNMDEEGTFTACRNNVTCRSEILLKYITDNNLFPHIEEHVNKVKKFIFSNDLNDIELLSVKGYG